MPEKLDSQLTVWLCEALQLNPTEISSLAVATIDGELTENVRNVENAIEV